MKTQSNRNGMLNASKQYKKVINKTNVNFKPCDYWRYVNSLNSRSKTPDVDMNLCFNFFKDLNSNDTENVHPIDPDFSTETFAHSLDEPTESPQSNQKSQIR